ncbi:hypothetical protein LCGC14_1692260 [marine sediment metagenome]|uniref:Uncharacterized protein n=1 Tax=marine sediment metagenome TaxID=412755 RepID=A0A0F9K0Y5_9ZZZZ
MRPLTHALSGLIFSLLVFAAFPNKLVGVTLIFLSSFLIDVDHYFYYVYHKRDISLKNAYRWFIRRIEKLDRLSEKEQQKYKRIFLIFHGIEFWAILIFFSFFHSFFLWILLGITVHIVLDIIDERKDRELVIGKVSQIYVYIKNKNKKEFKFK